jgi:hypothetical protein
MIITFCMYLQLGYSYDHTFITVALSFQMLFIIFYHYLLYYSYVVV